MVRVINILSAVTLVNGFTKRVLLWIYLIRLNIIHTVMCFVMTSAKLQGFFYAVTKRVSSSLMIIVLINSDNGKFLEHLPLKLHKVL